MKKGYRVYHVICRIDGWIMGRDAVTRPGLGVMPGVPVIQHGIDYWVNAKHEDEAADIAKHRAFQDACNPGGAIVTIMTIKAWWTKEPWEKFGRLRTVSDERTNQGRPPTKRQKKTDA